MRVIYLTLAFFIVLGISAACRTPPLVADNCRSSGDDPAACTEARPGNDG